MNRAESLAAFKEDPRGVRLEIMVSAGAARSCFGDRFDPWRNRLGVRVRSPPEKGRANREVIRLVAHFFDCPETQVRIIQGETTSLKTVFIEGLSLEDATRRLSGDAR
jgi:uncharacterized protein